MECEFALKQLLLEWRKGIARARDRIFQQVMLVVRQWNFQGSLAEAGRRWRVTAFSAVRTCWNAWERPDMPILVDSDSSDSDIQTQRPRDSFRRGCGRERARLSAVGE